MQQYLLMATEKGGVLFPEDVDPLTGTTVAEVLDSKHPPSQLPSPTSLPTYPSTPDFIDLDRSPQIQLNGLPIGFMVPQVWEVPMLMLSHIGSQGMAMPARSCTLFLLPLLLAGLPMISLPGLSTKPS